MQRTAPSNSHNVVERIYDNPCRQPTNSHPKIRQFESQKKVKLPENCRFQKSLKQVLLVINFNFVHYTVNPTLRKFYTPHFKQVVFCGPEEDARYEFQRGIPRLSLFGKSH